MFLHYSRLSPAIGNRHTSFVTFGTFPLLYIGSGPGANHKGISASPTTPILRELQPALDRQRS